MRAFPFTSLFAVAVITTLAFPVEAQSPNAAQSQKRPTPKDLQVVDDVPSPPIVKDYDPAKDIKVTTRQSGADTIEEYRLGGRLYPPPPYDQST